MTNILQDNSHELVRAANVGVKGIVAILSYVSGVLTVRDEPWDKVRHRPTTIGWWLASVFFLTAIFGLIAIHFDRKITEWDKAEAIAQQKESDRKALEQSTIIQNDLAANNKILGDAFRVALVSLPVTSIEVQIRSNEIQSSLKKSGLPKGEFVASHDNLDTPYYTFTSKSLPSWDGSLGGPERFLNAFHLTCPIYLSPEKAVQGQNDVELYDGISGIEYLDKITLNSVRLAFHYSLRNKKPQIPGAAYDGHRILVTTDMSKGTRGCPKEVRVIVRSYDLVADTKFFPLFRDSSETISPEIHFQPEAR